MPRSFPSAFSFRMNSLPVMWTLSVENVRNFNASPKFCFSQVFPQMLRRAFGHKSATPAVFYVRDSGIAVLVIRKIETRFSKSTSHQRRASRSFHPSPTTFRSQPRPRRRCPRRLRCFSKHQKHPGRRNCKTHRASARQRFGGKLTVPAPGLQRQVTINAVAAHAIFH